MTRVSTAANAANLAPSFLESVVGRYRGTRLGRQELDAELLEDDEVWEIRSRAPSPNIRLFGRFAMPNVFIDKLGISIISRAI